MEGPEKNEQVPSTAKHGSAKAPWRYLETESHVEPSVQAKLSQWDKDQKGRLSIDEFKAAMEELRRLSCQSASLKQSVLVGSAVLAVVLAITIGIAAAYVESTRGIFHETLGPRRFIREVGVKTQDHGMESIRNMLSVDLLTDEWAVSDDALREIDTVSFELTNGSFFDLEVIEVERQDSGKNGETDKLELRMADGTELRVWESAGSLEVKWPTSVMWEVLDVTGDEREMLDVDLKGEPVEDDPPDRHGALKPPERLLATARRGKGASGAGGAGAGYGHGRSSMIGRGSTGTHFTGFYVVPWYGHRPYSRSGSHRNCYSDEEYKDGECVRKAAASPKARLAGAAAAAAVLGLSIGVCA